MPNGPLTPKKCPFKATCQIENNYFDFFGDKSGSYSGNKKFMTLLPNTHIARVVWNTLYAYLYIQLLNTMIKSK